MVAPMRYNKLWPKEIALLLKRLSVLQQRFTHAKELFRFPLNNNKMLLLSEYMIACQVRWNMLLPITGRQLNKMQCMSMS